MKERGQKSEGLVAEILGLVKHCKDFSLDYGSELELYLDCFLGDIEQGTYFSEY